MNYNCSVCYLVLVCYHFFNHTSWISTSRSGSREYLMGSKCSVTLWPTVREVMVPAMKPAWRGEGFTSRYAATLWDRNYTMLCIVMSNLVFNPENEWGWSFVLKHV